MKINMKLLLALCLVVAAAKVAHSQGTGDGCNSATDFIFLLDSSTLNQMAQVNRWGDVTRFIYNVILSLGNTLDSTYDRSSSGLRFALLQYYSGASTTIGPNTIPDYIEMAAAAAKAEPIDAGDNLQAGLLEAEEYLNVKDENSIRNTVLVVISEFRNVIPRNVIETADRLKAEYDVTIVAVGINQTNTERLAQITTNRTRSVFQGNYVRLSNYIRKLITVMCEIPAGSPSFQPTNCLRDFVFVLDASQSINADGWSKLRKFAGTLAGNMFTENSNTRVGVVTFSTVAAIGYPLTPYANDMVPIIETINHLQALTSPAKGLGLARNMTSDRGRARYVIIITDGVATADAGEEIRIADEMRAEGINIIAVGVGRNIDKGSLERLVGDANKARMLFYSPDFDVGIMSQLNQITASAACAARQPLPQEPPGGEPAVSVCVDRPLSIVLLVDSSGSIVEKGQDNWSLMRDFAIGLGRTLTNLARGAEVATVLFSDDARTVNTLTADGAYLEQELRGASHMNGFTNQASAFRRAEEIFQEANPNAIKYIIMVTDGEPNLENGTEIVIAERLKKQQGVSIIMVGVTNRIDTDNLMNLATSRRYVLYSPSFQNLNAQLPSVINATTNCPQTTVAPPAPTTPAPVCLAADVVFVIDMSGSIKEGGLDNPDKLKLFVINSARAMALRYTMIRFGLVSFSDSAKVEASLRDYRTLAEFIDTVNRVDITGWQTNIAAGIRTARQDIQNGGENLPQIILVTDGRATAEAGNETYEAEETRKFFIRISAIGVTDQIDEATLTKLTGTSDRVFNTPNFDTLQNEIVQVVQVTCGQGSSAILPTEAPRCEGQLDMVFVLDASGSITEINGSNWYSALQLISEIMQYFSGKNPNSQFGLVVFSTLARIEYRLNSDVNTMIRKLGEKNVTYDQDRTNIPDGLEKAREVFNDRQNVRPNADKIAVLITDGISNERIGGEYLQARYLRDMGVKLVSVGITQAPNFTLLGNISSVPVVRSPNFEILRKEIDPLISAVCNRNGNNANNNNGNNNGGNGQNSFPIRNPGSQCSGGYTVIALDLSNRLAESGRPFGGVDGMLKLVERTVRDIAARYQRMQFALVTFAKTANIIIDFNDYRSVADFVSYLNILEPVLNIYDSNLADGLRATNDEVFKGLGRSIQKQVIVFTDGVTTRDSGIEHAIAETLRNSQNTIIMSVALTPLANVGILRRMSDDPSLVFLAPDYTIANPSSLVDRIRPDCSSNAVSLQVASNVCPGDLAFIIDASGPTSPYNWAKLQNFVKEVLEEYGRSSGMRIKVGIVNFRTRASITIPMTSSLSKVRYAIDRLKAPAQAVRANFSDGLHLAYSLFRTKEVRKMAVLITDGNPGTDFFETFTESEKLLGMGVNIAAVRVSDNKRDMPRLDFLSRITGDNMNKVILVPDYDRLVKDVQRIMKVACGHSFQGTNEIITEGGNSNPVPAPAPVPVAPPRRPARPDVRRRTTRPTTTATTTTATTTTTEAPRRRAPARSFECQYLDVALIVDSNYGMRRDDWNLTIDAISTLTDAFLVFKYNVRVALIQYASNPQLTYDFTRFQTNRRLRAGLQKIQQVGWGKDASNAFNFATRQLRSGTDRASAENLVIVIMDGLSDTERYNTDAMAYDLRNLPNTSVFVIGITRGLTPNQIQKQMSYATDGLYVGVRDFYELQDQISDISDSICGRGSRLDP